MIIRYVSLRVPSTAGRSNLAFKRSPRLACGGLAMTN